MTRARPPRAALAAALFLLACGPPVIARGEPKGRRVYLSGHSFHYFVPPLLADVAKKAGKR